MEIFNHPACTEVIGKPSDMTDAECAGLPVARVTTDQGQFAVSFWKPSIEEVKLLMAGGTIALWVRAPGRQHPVVSVGVEPKPGQTEVPWEDAVTVEAHMGGPLC